MELPDNIKENESLITNKVQISNKFNEYFVNVGPNLANKIKDYKQCKLQNILRREICKLYLFRCSY